MIKVVHFQFMNDSRVADALIDSKRPFLASLVPNLLDKEMKTEEGEDIYKRIHPHDNYYPDWAIDFFRENAGNLNITWIQEGYRHCCGRCFNKFEENGGREKWTWPDPFHEHICLNGKTQNLKTQIEVIKKGRNLLKEKLGVVSEGYCPPNHLYNRDTERAVSENRMSYFLIRNKIGIPIYRKISKDYKMVVVPEAKEGETFYEKSRVVYTYFDSLTPEKVRHFLNNARYFADGQEVIEPLFRSRLNHTVVNFGKRMRDWKGRFDHKK